VADDWVSVVPTFNPDTDSLELIHTLAHSAPVLVSDDASVCTADRILAAAEATDGIRVVRHDRNRGIGRALNEGLAFARQVGAAWLLTVDQDSSLDEQYAPEMVEHAKSLVQAGVHLGALGCGNVQDASGKLTYPERMQSYSGQSVPITDEVVQSGTLWSVDALRAAGGFDQTLGMDAVDAAACLVLRERGMIIALHPGVTLQHRIEGAQRVQILGRTVTVTGHSRLRRLAIVRNRLTLFPREWAMSPPHAIRTVRRSLVNYSAFPLRKQL